MVRPIDPDTRRIGAVLRSIREQQGLTQVEVAVALGKKEGAYAAYEAGRSRFTVPELRLVADALNVTTPYLARRLGLCGDDGNDLAHALTERFGPTLGRTLARLDMVLANIQQGEVDAAVLILESISERGERRERRGE